MSAYEDSYKSQLQGVSEQVARERQPGQLTLQENMLSDAVTNLRRRPGAALAWTIKDVGAQDGRVLVWDTDINNMRVQVILNTVDGVLRVRDSAGTVSTLPAYAEFVTTHPERIQTAVVGDEMFLVNTDTKPLFGKSYKELAEAGQATIANPERTGWFEVKAGAFSKTYTVVVARVGTVGGVAQSKEFSYTTPNGATAGDAAKAIPEYIAEQIAAAINLMATQTAGQAGAWDVYAIRQGASVVVYSNNAAHSALTVTTTAGSVYCTVSGRTYIRNSDDLPAILSSVAAGLIMRTGDYSQPRYYMYDVTRSAWLECGAYDAPQTLTKMPVGLKFGTVWGLNNLVFEGCFAGDDKTNPAPPFMTKGITGLSTYQGRLVILAGNMVSMSASANPRRFYRSTVTAVLAGDCIHIGATAATAASYKYAVAFGKDLLLFSDKYQAVVPGGTQAITPSTATVVVTSTYETDTLSEPVGIGRTLMYSTPRSAQRFGIMEMMPSQYAEAQYTSYDSTPHLPGYMQGRCRFAVSSSVSGMVVFGSSIERDTLVVHEYTWQGDTKVQQSWHKWTFRWPISYVYFSGAKLQIVFTYFNDLVCMSIDPKSYGGADYIPFYDFHVRQLVAQNRTPVPGWLLSYNVDKRPTLSVCVATGPRAGEPVGFTMVGDTIVTTTSFPEGEVFIGLNYTSRMIPTPPMVKDKNGVKVSTNKLTVLRFMIGTNGSREYKVAVHDQTNRTEDTTLDAPTLYYSSEELALDRARVGSDSIAIVPCRTAADTTQLQISTDGPGELNIVSIEYVLRYHEKIKRA